MGSHSSSDELILLVCSEVDVVGGGWNFQTFTWVFGLPKQTARYLPSVENVAIHAGEPDSVDGERVPIGSTDDDGIKEGGLIRWIESEVWR